MTFEQELMKEIDKKRNEQWERCKVVDGLVKNCTLYNKEPCPRRCNYYIEKIKQPLWVNENIQWKRIV